MRNVGEVQSAERSCRDLLPSGKRADPVEYRANRGRNGKSDLERLESEPIGVAPEEHNANGEGGGSCGGHLWKLSLPEHRGNHPGKRKGRSALGATLTAATSLGASAADRFPSRLALVRNQCP